MNINELASLPLAQRMEAMQVLWNSMTQDEADKLVAIPAWHKSVVLERVNRHDAGQEPVLSWDEAKRSIRSAIEARKNPGSVQ